MKSLVHGADLTVPIACEEAADPIDGERQDGQDPECPSQAQVVDHGVGSERVGESSEAGPRGPDTVGQGAFLSEPLRDKANGAGEEKAHAGAEGDALAEDQVPYLACEGGTYEGGTTCLQGCQWLLASCVYKWTLS